MSRPCTYTDTDLASAVAAARSWRGVLRALGLTATSSAALRSVRRRADALGLDHDHFTGQRRWSEAELARAVAASNSWAEVSRTVGLTESSAVALKGHAVRLGLDVTHLDLRSFSPAPGASLVPDLAHLPRAGTQLAAGWLTLCGHQVSWPLEPARYDLITECDGLFQRVQVKTATVRTKSSFTVWLSTTRRGRTTYDVDEIDSFFVVDAELSCYLIPVSAVGGLHAITLSAYDQFRVRAAPSCA